MWDQGGPFDLLPGGGGPSFAGAGVAEVRLGSRTYFVDTSSLGLLHYSPTGEIRVAQETGSERQFALKIVALPGEDEAVRARFVSASRARAAAVARSVPACLAGWRPRRAGERGA
jgi:hypothetical protein